jgi:signal transduction histidine kinase
MGHFNSISSRVMWLHVVAIAIISIAIPIGVNALLNSTAMRFQNGVLRQHAQAIAEFVDLGSDGRVRLELPADLQALYAHGFDGFAYAVLDGSGHVLHSSLRDPAPIIAFDPMASSPTYFQRSNGGTTYYGASVAVTRGNQPVWIQVTQDLSAPDVVIDDIVAGFVGRVSWIVVPLLLLLFGVNILIVRRALRPVVETSKMAQAIAPSRVDLRLPTRDMPAEIFPLVEAVNHALDRLERGYRIQREFTADAAHELRTPITILRMRIDMLTDQQGTDALRADLEGMSRIITQLLEIAELDSFVLDRRSTVELGAVCAEVLAFLAPLALSQGKEVALARGLEPSYIHGDSGMLFQAVRNLVENAIRHTAPGTTVDIETSAPGRVRILDRGPGIPAHERELIFRRFWRRDRRHWGSAGLGLSIVARVVEVHGGSITVADREGGGATFELHFTNVESACRGDAPVHNSPAVEVDRISAGAA